LLESAKTEAAATRLFAGKFGGGALAIVMMTELYQRQQAAHRRSFQAWGKTDKLGRENDIALEALMEGGVTDH
jgi:hypothetical protein